MVKMYEFGWQLATFGLRSDIEADPVKNEFFVESRKSESSFQNGTDLTADSGSTTWNGSIYDWSIARSGRQSGALSAPAGAAYLARQGALQLTHLTVDQSQFVASRPQLSGSMWVH